MGGTGESNEGKNGTSVIEQLKRKPKKSPHDFHVVMMGGLLWDSFFGERASELELFLTEECPVEVSEFMFYEKNLSFYCRRQVGKNLFRYFERQLAPSIRDQQSSVSHPDVSANDRGT